MIPLTEIAQTLVRSTLKPGDIAIDATVGNGFDTQFLAESVGPTGTVYGFDIQLAAVQATSSRLADACLNNVHLLERDHAEMQSAIPREFHGRVSAIMWNLGYLPGGDKQLTTALQSTLAAIQSGLVLLAGGGIMTIIAYTGHPGGFEETAAVEALLRGLNPHEYQFTEPSPAPNRISPPRLFVVRRCIG